MTPEQYRNDMLYHAGLSMAQTMLEQGLITEAEFVQIDAKLLAEFQPYLGSLLSENACYYSDSE